MPVPEPEAFDSSAPPAVPMVIDGKLELVPSLPDEEDVGVDQPPLPKSSPAVFASN